MNWFLGAFKEEKSLWKRNKVLHRRIGRIQRQLITDFFGTERNHSTNSFHGCLLRKWNPTNNYKLNKNTIKYEISSKIQKIYKIYKPFSLCRWDILYTCRIGDISDRNHFSWVDTHDRQLRRISTDCLNDSPYFSLWFRRILNQYWLDSLHLFARQSRCF